MPSLTKKEQKMSDEVLAALSRIEAIAHYYGSLAGQSDEITEAFKGITEEASEAIAIVKGASK